MNASALIPTVAVEEDFRTRAHTALGDPQLRNNFRTAMDSLMTKRAASFSDAHEREHLRALGNAVRARALSKLPDLLEQLEQNLTAVELKLDVEDLAALDEASKLAPEYPGWMIEHTTPTRIPLGARIKPN